MMWNPWHGCRKISEGCLNCYVYRRDAQYDKDSTKVTRTRAFDLPVQRLRGGASRMPSGSDVFACMTSDFFLEEADGWRPEAWRMIALRPDVRFSIITKRIHRFATGLPADWGKGYAHVRLAVTCENQRRASERLPIFWSLPIRRRFLICEPLLGPIDLTGWLRPGLERVLVGGESGEEARPCDWDWVADLRRQCVAAGVAFTFRQTGACFVKDRRLYRIPRREQMRQAQKAGMDWNP